MNSLNQSNMKLLDGMHEGLLIISRKNKEVMFCNKPSQKFLEKALTLKDTEPNTAQSQIFKPKIFKLVKL